MTGSGRNISVVELGEAENRPRRVAIGTFDGVHLGHQAVVAGVDTVLTFEPHPLTVVRPDAAPKLLMPFEIKRDVLEGLGVEELVVIPFDREFTRTTPEQFIDEVLVGKLGAEFVSVGENFRFGTGAVGTPEMLSASQAFETRIVPLIEIDGETVSSTRIRGLLAEGRVDLARECLGTPFMVEGEVVHGDGRGRELGYPTANIVPDPQLAVPAHGVYAAFADGLPAAVNVGVRPTFGDQGALLVETYILDTERDLYGHRLRVAFIEKIRDEEAFAEVGDLVDQMARDVTEARRVCASFQPPSADPAGG